jgi:WD40 repeat protein
MAAQNSAQRTPQIILKLSQKEVFDLAWSPNGRYIVGKSAAGLGYTLWDAKTGKKLHEISDSYGPWAGEGNVSFTPDSRYVILIPRAPIPSGASRVAFALWNVDTGVIDKMIEAPYRGQPPVFSNLDKFSISNEAGRMAAVFSGRSAPGNVIIYDTNTWQIIDASVPVPTRSGLTFGFALSPSGRRVAMGGVAAGTYRGRPRGIIWIYDVATNTPVRIIEEAHADFVTHLAFGSEDSRLISAADQSGAVRNAATQQLEALHDGDPVRAWDIATGQKVASFELDTTMARSLVVSPNGRYIAFGGNSRQRDTPDEYRIWDRQSGILIGTIEGSLYAAAFSPDSCCLAVHAKGWFEQILVVRLPAD